jgi:hypothetical protein
MAEMDLVLVLSSPSVFGVVSENGKNRTLSRPQRPWRLEFARDDLGAAALAVVVRQTIIRWTTQTMLGELP